MEPDPDLVVAVADAMDVDEDLVVEPAASSGGAGGASRQRGRRWRHPDEGTFLCWTIIDPSMPSPEGLRRVKVPGYLEPMAAAPEFLWGLGVVRCRYRIREPSASAIDNHRALSPARLGAPRPVGFLEYEALDVFFSIGDYPQFIRGNAPTIAKTLQEAYGDVVLSEDLGAARNAMDSHEIKSVLTISLHAAVAMLAGELAVVSSVALTGQLRFENVVGEFPRKYVLRHHWRRLRHHMRDAGDTEPASATTSIARSGHPFLRHPRKRGVFPTDSSLTRPRKKCRWDPLKLLNATALQHLIRDERNFTLVLGRAKKYLMDPSDDEAQVPRDPSEDPSRATRQRARQRADVVNMLLERREFAEWYEQDLIASVHVYSDGSPVTGVELQGQAVDLFLKSGALHRRTLPGSELSYGMCGCANKCVALAWGFFLTIGPEIEKLVYIFSKVKSCTTDGGTEVNLVVTPNFLKAFYRWLGGAPLQDLKDVVERNLRLMPESIRIIGMGHTTGGMMKSVCAILGDWNERLDGIRCMVKFYRNATYRQHLARCLAGKVDLAPLAHFDASFLKWRYETLAHATQSLRPLRAISNLLRREFFNDPQDKEEIKKVIAAGTNAKLWRFIECAGTQVLERIDGLRRWSLVCPCEPCRKLRHEKKRHIACDRNSRRLHQVWKHVKKEIVAVRQEAADMTPAKCEGDAEMAQEIRNMLEKYASLLEIRCKYFRLVPWRLATAHEVDGAKACLYQLRETNNEHLDPLSLRVKNTLLHDIEVVANGGAVSEALMHEVRALWNCPLDEGWGEGYHRGTNLAIRRAPSSTTQTVVQEVRIEEAIARIAGVQARFGKIGRNLIRFEWWKWKRVLQSDKRRLHRPMGMTAKVALRRIYRQDEMAKANWDDLISPNKVDPPLPFEDGADEAEREYIGKVFKPNQYYSIDRKPALVPVADAPVVGDQPAEPQLAPVGPTLFKVIAIHQGRQRPKVMPTIETRTDVVLHGKIALHVQFLENRRPDATDVECASVYSASDPIWLDHSQLGSFKDIAYRLFRFQSVVPDEDRPGCLVLADRKHAAPGIPLMDESCPTLVLLWYLKKQNWSYQTSMCVHTLANIDTKVCDGRDIMRHKLYYMVLCKLQSVLTRTSSVPSTESQLFFRLLLAGKRIEPGLPIEDYITAAGGRGAVLPLPVPEPGVDDLPAPPEEDAGDEDLVVVGVGAPPPKPKGAPARKKLPIDMPLPQAAPAPKPKPNPAPKPKPKPLPLPPPVPVVGSPPAAGGGCPGPGSGGGAGSSGDGPPPLPPLETDEDLVVVPGPPAAVEPRGRAQGRVLERVDAIGGGWFIFDNYSRKGKLYPNYTLNCLTCPRTTGCQKTKGASAANTARHGDIEPLAFLHAWRPTPIINVAHTHAWHDPSSSEVDAIVERHRGELEALVETCRRKAEAGAAASD